MIRRLIALSLVGYALYAVTQARAKRSAELDKKSELAVADVTTPA